MEKLFPNNSSPGQPRWKKNENLKKIINFFNVIIRESAEAKKKWTFEIIINFLAGQPGTPKKVGQQSQIPLEFPSFSGDFPFSLFFQSKQLLIIGAPVAAKENTFFSIR